MYRIQWTEYSKKDYDQLDGSQKILIDKAINRLMIRGMSEGEYLKGELSACKKIKHRKAGLRIIFREAADEIEIIEIVAIGQRDKKKVYKQLLFDWKKKKKTIHIMTHQS